LARWFKGRRTPPNRQSSTPVGSITAEIEKGERLVRVAALIAIGTAERPQISISVAECKTQAACVGPQPGFCRSGSGTPIAFLH